MRLSFDVPDEWDTSMRSQAAIDGYRSKSAFVRHLIAQACKLPDGQITWGGTKVHQVDDVEEVHQVTQLDEHDEVDVPKPPIARSGSPRVTTELTPAEIIQRRKAEAQAKFATPTKPSKGETV